MRVGRRAGRGLLFQRDPIKVIGVGPVYVQWGRFREGTRLETGLDVMGRVEAGDPFLMSLFS